MKKNSKIKVKTLDEIERMIITNTEKIALIESLLDQMDEMEVSPEKSKEIEEYIKNGGYYITADEWDEL